MFQGFFSSNIFCQLNGFLHIVYYQCGALDALWLKVALVSSCFGLP